MRTSPTKTTDPVPWALRGLDGPCTRQALCEVADLVAELQRDDIGVPACWYVHGWVRARLLALLWWRRRAEATDAQSAAQWWSHALGPLQRDWEPLVGHHGRHPAADMPYGGPVPMPPFEAFVATLVEEADRAAL